MKVIINENQLNLLFETERIRRVRDDEYPKFQKDYSDKQFSFMKDYDDKLNSERKKEFKENGLEYNAKTDDIDSLKKYKSIDSNGSKVVDNLQKELTKNLIGRLGTDKVSVDDIDVPNNIQKTLMKNGIEVSIKGKVFSFGNTKLPPSTMIVNLTTAFNCPSKCPLKKTVCYAGKSEKQYKNNELRNLRNELFLEKLTVKEILKLLDAYIMNAPIRIKNIRISESGDFKSQEVVDFCDKIAGHIKAKYGIKTTCYTRQPFDFTNCKNLIVNSSVASENFTKGADRNYIICSKDFFKKLPNTNDGRPKEISINGKPKMIYKCKCDCYKCNFCYNTKEENGEKPDMRTNVYVLKH